MMVLKRLCFPGSSHRLTHVGAVGGNKNCCAFSHSFHLILNLLYITRQNSGLIIVQLGEIEGVRGLR